ncbi:hypothetical protein ACERK3_09480 [Phycisphaerales bacterium AB-hyl4]|uniref:Uncharacterized protein n=1 Tax=Natronomicrosphaera hydrolytica TaxID=3242702 RepID=A0ABV4U701_9BACT
MREPKSKHDGVDWSRRKQMWHATYGNCCDGLHDLGYHDDEQDAADAVKAFTESHERTNDAI